MEAQRCHAPLRPCVRRPTVRTFDRPTTSRRVLTHRCCGRLIRQRRGEACVPFAKHLPASFVCSCRARRTPPARATATARHGQTSCSHRGARFKAQAQAGVYNNRRRGGGGGCARSVARPQAAKTRALLGPRQDERDCCESRGVQAQAQNAGHLSRRPGACTICGALPAHGERVLTLPRGYQEDALPQLESFLPTASKTKALPQFLPRATGVVHKGTRIKRFAAETVSASLPLPQCATSSLGTRTDASRRRRASLQFCPTACSKTTPSPL